MLKKYSKEVEEKMKNHYEELNEKEKRHYAAIEAIKLGHGSKVYISLVLNISRITIVKGIKEINRAVSLVGRIRKIGGGRKSIIEKNPEIEKTFTSIMEKHTAGSPMNETVWTHLKLKEIAELMSSEKEDLVVSPHIVKQLLEKNDYKYRTMQKKAIMSEPENRDAQFLKIEKLKEEYEKNNDPVISIDVKKKS